MKQERFQIPQARLQAFCRKWNVRELSLFGSALRTDFDPDSDVNLLVSFQPGTKQDVDRFLAMRDELSALFGGREIDLVEKRLLRNPFRRHEILTTREVLHAA